MRAARFLVLLLAVILIRLTDPKTGLPVWINPQNIAGIVQDGASARLIFSGGGSMDVQESTVEVLRRLTDSGFSRN